MIYTIGLAALALLTAQTLARADDAHAVKIKFPGEGDTVLVEKTATQVNRDQLLDAAGKTFSDKSTTLTETYLYKETILAREAGKAPTKVRREYEKARLKRDGTTTVLRYEGKTLLIEKIGGKFHFLIEGGKELADKDVVYLDEEFNRGANDVRDFEKYFVPADPVKVGEVYRLDMPGMVKALTSTIPMEGNAAKAEGTGKLVKMYTRDDKPFGKFAVQFSIPITTLTLDETKNAVLEGSKITGDSDLDLRIDGLAVHSTSKGALKIDVSTMIPLPDGSTGKMIVTIRSDDEETDKELPKE